MKTLNISDEIYEIFKDQLGAEEKTDISKKDDLIGKKWFIRTVTYHLTGEVEKIVGDFLVLKKAAWIAESGRFTQAIKDGILSEVEPVGIAFVNLNSITDMFPWKHDLPQKQR